LSSFWPRPLICQYSRLSTLKIWFQWLAKQRHILYNPAGELDMPKPGFRLAAATTSAVATISPA
jgi:integrase/recombinase XerD